MMSIQSLIGLIQAHVPEPLLLVALLGFSLAFIFAGETLVKLAAFLLVGLIGATFGGTLAVQYLSHSWEIVGVLLGFVIGGLLGVALIPIAVGLAVGYAGYVVALDFALSSTMALIAGVALFIVGLALSSKIVSVATALIGGLLLFNALTYYGLGSTISTVVAALLTVIGLWYQLGPERRMSQPATTSVGGQPSDRR
jgi:hypothetical protein